MKRLALFLLVLTLCVGANAAKTTTIHKDTVKEVTINRTEKDGNLAKDSLLVKKLSPEQLMQLEQEKLDVERKKIEAEHPDALPLSSFAIFMICLLPFLFVAVIIGLNVRAKNAESKRRYDLYTKSLEMGQTVPENFFDEPKKANPSSNLKRGILWTAVGLGLLIYFIIDQKTNGLILGIVPTFVGIGYLLVHFLDKPKTDSTVKDDEQHG
ncbi:MAG: DUF6249 domain-containing protein [Bacteroidota bacterium]|nr:DUF6249 domain-containing protein [Bacteroidota bacterium]